MIISNNRQFHCESWIALYVIIIFHLTRKGQDGVDSWFSIVAVATN